MAKSRESSGSRPGKSSLADMKPKSRSYTGNMEDLKKQIAGGGEKGSGKGDDGAENEGARPHSDGTQKKKRINFDVPEQLHRQFKAVAGMQGKTMTEVLTGLMDDYVKEANGELF